MKIPILKLYKLQTKKFSFPECVFGGGGALYDVAWLPPLCVCLWEKKIVYLLYVWLVTSFNERSWYFIFRCGATSSIVSSYTDDVIRFGCQIINLDPFIIGSYLGWWQWWEGSRRGGGRWTLCRRNYYSGCFTRLLPHCMDSSLIAHYQIREVVRRLVSGGEERENRIFVVVW